jgi:hypothetical protein
VQRAISWQSRHTFTGVAMGAELAAMPIPEGDQTPALPSTAANATRERAAKPTKAKVMRA